MPFLSVRLMQARSLLHWCKEVGIVILKSTDSVAYGLCFNGNLPTLQIRKGAVKHQSAFAPSIVVYASHCSLRPAEDQEKVFSGAEGENNMFVL